MCSSLYHRLAVTNIKNHRRIYVPFAAASAGVTAMLYIIQFLLNNSELRSRTVAQVLSMGTVVITIFSVIVMLYANSFVMKQRRRELGLYNVLGMEKRHIARLMATETLYIGSVSVVLGIGGGILFSKLALLLLCDLMGVPKSLGFEVPMLAVVYTLAVFGAIFAIMLVYNISRVGLVKPIELLKSKSTGEREPRVKWVIAVVGVLTLGSGYAIALLTKTPSMALVLFFVAVILVIIGTYCLFTAGSIAVLKIMRKNKRYYYNKKHFVPVSGMLYRMKRNAAGLANICILSTMVLVMISSTVCLYYGMEDLVRTFNPRNVELIVVKGVDDEYASQLSSAIDETVKKSGVTVKNVAAYRNSSTYAYYDGKTFSIYAYGAGSLLRSVKITLLPLEDYNLLNNTEETLERDSVIVYAPNMNFENGEIYFGSAKMKVEKVVHAMNVVNMIHDDETIAQVYIVAADTDAIIRLRDALEKAQGDFADDESYFDAMTMIKYYYGADVDGVDDEDKLATALIEMMAAAATEDYASGHEARPYSVTKASNDRKNYLEMYGGLFFLGIILGIIFISAAVLIMYYKQLSEGYEDRERYVIMRQVGMTRREIRSSVRSQVLTVFFLPLAAAGVHMAFAFPMIRLILTMFGLTNSRLFMICALLCFAVFTLVYLAAYVLTAKRYYKIVSSPSE